MYMNREEIELTLRKIKFCIRRKIKIKYRDADYFASVLNLRHSERDGFYYTVQLDDVNRLDSSITVGIDEVEWPTHGNGYEL